MNSLSTPLQVPSKGSSPSFETADQLEPETQRSLRLILYFDIFQYPLSFAELLQYGHPPGTPPARIEAALEALIARGVLERQGDLYYLAGSGAWVATRLARAATSRELWRKVPTASRILASFPFVRGALVTGSLANDSAGPEADIDFLVFTAPGRVWLCRSLLAGFRKVLPGDLRKYLCVNVFLAENALTWDQENMYLAVEIGRARPVLNEALGARFRMANPWLSQYLPGLVPQQQRLPDDPENATWLERSLEGRLGDWLEGRLAESWERFWSRKYNALSEGERHQRFRASPDLSTNHFHDFQARTLAAFRERLERYGLADNAEFAAEEK